MTVQLQATTASLIPIVCALAITACTTEIPDESSQVEGAEESQLISWEEFPERARTGGDFVSAARA
jgi:hypothetical protein